MVRAFVFILQKYTDMAASYYKDKYLLPQKFGV